MTQRKYITVAAAPKEFAAITAAAKKARMSRSQWMLAQAMEALEAKKLSRESKPKESRDAA